MNEMLEIKMGNSENDFTEIMTDDASAKTFAVKGSYNLLMKMKYDR